MTTLHDALYVLVPMAYLGAWAAYAATRRAEATSWWPRALVGVALVCHVAQLAARGAILGQLPITTVYDSLAFLAMLMTLTFLMVELASRTASTGYDLLWPPLALVTFAHAFGPHQPRPNPELDSPLFFLHTVPAVGGIAAIFVSGLYGLLYLRLSRELREKRFDGLFRRIPDLSVLATMNFRAALVGLLLVTAAIGWGATWYGDLFERVNVAEPKIFLTLLVWTIMLFPVFGKLARRWPDRWTAVASVVSLSLVILSVLVTMLPFVSFHGHT